MSDEATHCAADVCSRNIDRSDWYRCHGCGDHYCGSHLYMAPRRSWLCEECLEAERAGLPEVDEEEPTPK